MVKVIAEPISKLYKKECPKCKKTFSCQSKKTTYCSKVCVYESQKRTVILKCHKCGSEYETWLSHSKKRSDQGRVIDGNKKNFCSKECHLSWQKETRRTQLDSPKKRLFRKTIAMVKNAIFRGKEHRYFRSILGYSPSDLRAHIEKKFKPGMSWSNYGEWHIDHIIPLSKLNYTCPTDPDFRRAWSLKNLQPLWAQDNFRKSDNIEAPMQPSLSFGEAA